MEKIYKINKIWTKVSPSAIKYLIAACPLCTLSYNHIGKRNIYKTVVVKPPRKTPIWRPSMDERIILKLILNKYVTKMWNGLQCAQRCALVLAALDMHTLLSHSLLDIVCVHAYLLKHVPQSVSQVKMVVKEPWKEPLLLVADTWLLALCQKTILEPL